MKKKSSQPNSILKNVIECVNHTRNEYYIAVSSSTSPAIPTTWKLNEDIRLNIKGEALLLNEAVKLRQRNCKELMSDGLKIVGKDGGVFVPTGMSITKKQDTLVLAELREIKELMKQILSKLN